MSQAAPPLALSNGCSKSESPGRELENAKAFTVRVYRDRPRTQQQRAEQLASVIITIPSHGGLHVGVTGPRPGRGRGRVCSES